MAITVALPKGFKSSESGLVFTALVPSLNGCNLSCKDCFIAHRGENKQNQKWFNPTDYCDFIAALAKTSPLSLISIQGHEPLLPESWPFTKVILECGKRAEIPTALVTNGWHLEEHINELAQVAIEGITISLDSGKAVIHDMLRGRAGAFKRVSSGLKAAANNAWLQDRIIVSSILRPDGIRDLLSIISLLQELGIKQWVVTPLWVFRSDVKVFQLAGEPKDTLDDFERLQDLAEQAGITMMIDDDFQMFKEDIENGIIDSRLDFRIIQQLSKVVRLSASGHCSIGQQILNHIDDGIPIWDPSREKPEEFIRNRLSGLF